VDFEQQAAVGQPGDAARRPDIERIGARGDDDVGPEFARQAGAFAVQARDEGRHVAGAADTVAVVGRRIEPGVLDVVDDFVEPRLALQVRVARPYVRPGRCDDANPVAQPAPFARQVIGTVFHAVAQRTRIVVDQ
jgi:hypothetical protein